MQPGGKYEFDCAFVFSQDSANCYSNAACVLTRAKQDNMRVKRWFDSNNFPSCLSLAGVGIQQNTVSELQLTIYPNPASNYLYIEFAEMQQKTTVEVFDMLGKIVKAGTFNDTQKYIVLPIDDLSGGLYVLKIKLGNSFMVKKFVKE